MKRSLFGMALCLSLVCMTGAAFAQYTDIGDIQIYTVAGAPDETAPLWGDPVTVRGVVTCPPLIYNNGTHYIQDATGGIAFFLSGTGLSLGDEIELSGTVGAYSGEIQILSPSVNFIDVGVLPEPEEITIATLLGSYDYIGELVAVTGYVDLTTSDLLLYVGTDSLVIYIDSTTGISIAELAQDDEYMIISPVVNYNGLIELKPRYQGDLIEDPTGDTLPVISDVTCTDWVVLADETLEVTATIVDNSGIAGARLYYRDSTGDDDTGSFSFVPMTNTTGDTYAATTPSGWTGSQIDFYVEATDDGAQTVANPGGDPAGFFSTAVGFTSIYDMQYVHPDSSSQVNNYNGDCVTVKGIVTAGTGYAGSNSKFIMQQTDGPEGGRFCGLLIYEGSGSNTVFEGDLVEVAGRGNEYFGLSQIIPHNADAVTIDTWGNALPDAELVYAGILNDDADDDGDGFLGEAYESVWVRTYDSLVTTLANAYGEYDISDIAGDTITVNPSITLSYVPVIGDRAIIEGFMDYAYGNFQVAPIADADVIVNATPVGNLPVANAFGYITDIHPNPFNPMTQISFRVEKDSNVQLNVYGVRGNLVRQLVADQLPANSYDVSWDGKNDDGGQMASGTYFARLRIGTKYVGVEKMTLVK